MIAKFNKWFFTLVIIIALLPLIPTILMMLSPIAIAVLILFGIAAIAPVRRGVVAIFNGVVGIVSGIVGGIFKGIFASVGWLFGFARPKSRFMGFLERAVLLGRSNAGFLVDGKSSRLSESASYESLLIQGGMGRGKSSTFVMPNLLLPSRINPSFVIADTSGEIFQNTSGYLEKRGYQIRVLNLMDPQFSKTYNPLASAHAPQQIAEVAKTLIRSANGPGGQKANDPFWEQAAEKLIRIMAQCLQNQPDPQFRNLANLRHLITSFDAHMAPQGQLGKIDQFVLSATQNDPGTFAAYQAFVQGNLKTIQSVLMSADVALDPLATPEMAALTATSTLRFEELRQRKTALYVMVNQTQMDLYAFLLNLFYADLFRSLLKNQQNPGNPVWLFLDEFGHLQINGFEVFATTSRKYKIGFALFLQSLAQLEGRYGHANGQVIQESLGTEIYLPGMGLQTARELEARLGRLPKAPLMAASDIIRMKEHEALMLYSNRLPIKLKTRRYYQRSDLRRRAKLPPTSLPSAGYAIPLLIQL
jgi:type IV secretory pathway TraG/TraD family ATPase VirD4